MCVSSERKIAFEKIQLCMRKYDAQNFNYFSDFQTTETLENNFVTPIRFFVVACKQNKFEFVQIHYPAKDHIAKPYKEL